MSRRLALFALRLAVAVGGLALVARLALPDSDAGLMRTLRSAWSADTTEAWAYVSLAAAMFGVSYAVGALRFQWLLASAGHAVRLATLLRAYLVASFFNLVLPGLILGDVYRLADARRDTGQGSEVLGVIALERLLGFSALGTMALLAAPLLPADLEIRVSVGLFGAVVTVAPLAVLSATGLRLGGAVAGRVGDIWPRGGETATRALGAVGRVRAEPSVIARCFALSVVNQWLPVIAVIALAEPLDSSVAWYWFAAIVPFVTLASLIPISIGGTGIREGLFVALFGALGMRPEVALVLSLSTLFVALAWGGVGLALFALGRRREPVPA